MAELTPTLRGEAAAEGRRAGLRARARTSRRCSTRVHGHEAQIVAVASDQRRRPGAGAGARRAGIADARASPATTTPTAPARDAAMADWLERAAASSSSSSPATWRSSTRLHRPLPPTGIINVHPSLLPAFPGIARDAAGARLRREGLRRDRPPRRRGRRHRPDHPPARGRARRRARRRRGPRRCLRPLEHDAAARGGARCFAAGAVRARPGAPAPDRSPTRTPAHSSARRRRPGVDSVLAGAGAVLAGGLASRSAALASASSMWSSSCSRRLVELVGAALEAALGRRRGDLGHR